MCGACGTVTVHDPILGDTRTLRQHIEVAGAVNTVCSELPGGPRIRALADGWVVTGATGSTLIAHTVQELWAGVLASGFSAPEKRVLLGGALENYLSRRRGSDLAVRVAGLGATLARSRVG